MKPAINLIGKGLTDPHIKIFDDTAYLFASRDASPENSRFVMPDWQIWASDDLLHWTHVYTLRPEDTYIGRKFDGCWATDAVKKDSMFYWAFSEVDQTNDLHQIGVVRASNPAGPWEDYLGGPLVPDKSVGTAAYDPCFFTDEDGDVYILFGVWKYYIAKMSDDMRSLAEPPRPIEILHAEGPYGKGKTDDKVFLHKRGDLHYLSWGAYYAVSKHLHGPYKYRGCIVSPELLDEAFRGSTWPHGPTQGRHGSFFEWRGQWYFAYCEMCFSGNRYFRDFWISKVEYGEDGSILPLRMSLNAVTTPSTPCNGN